MVLQDSDGLLNSLVALMDKRKQKGSVTITFKRSKCMRKLSTKQAFLETKEASGFILDPVSQVGFKRAGVGSFKL